MHRCQEFTYPIFHVKFREVILPKIGFGPDYLVKSQKMGQITWFSRKRGQITWICKAVGADYLGFLFCLGSEYLVSRIGGAEYLVSRI